MKDSLILAVAYPHQYLNNHDESNQRCQHEISEDVVDGRVGEIKSHIECKGETDEDHTDYPAMDTSDTVGRHGVEDRLEAIRLMGSAFGLFGNKQAGDDAGRSWMERARDSGYEIKTVIEAMMEIAKEHGMTPPKELIEGSYRETQAGIEIGDLSEEEVDATPR